MNRRPLLAEILATPELNAIYRLPEGVVLPGTGTYHLDGDVLTSKEAMLREVGMALSFPDYYGQNWDALEECLHDLAGEGGLVLVIDHAAIPETADPEAWGILLDVLSVAAEDWQAAGRAFSVFLRGGHAAYPIISV